MKRYVCSKCGSRRIRTKTVTRFCRKRILDYICKTCGSKNTLKGV